MRRAAFGSVSSGAVRTGFGAVLTKGVGDLPVCPAFPLSVPSRRCRGWRSSRGGWRAAGGVEEVVRGLLPGPVPGEVQQPGAGAVGDPGRDVDELSADRGGACLG